MTRKIELVGIILIASLVLVSIFLISKGVLGTTPSESIRNIGEFYLYNTFNIYDKKWWAGSPEAITAILWDYRGLDTVFETTVLFLAIVGCMIIAYKPLKTLLAPPGTIGLTLIVKTVVRIVAIIIILVATNLALRGYISPGGGFAGGSAYSIAPLMIIAGFSAYALHRTKYSLFRAGIIRSLGLLVIVITSMIPLVCLGYILQNQFKTYSNFSGFPVFIGPVFIGGSLLYMNIGEFLVVSMEFVMVFLLLSLYLRRGEKK